MTPAHPTGVSGDHTFSHGVTKAERQESGTLAPLDGASPRDQSSYHISTLEMTVNLIE